MKVLNIHTRQIAAPKASVLDALSTLATQNDKVWPKEKWPKMKLSKGLAVGSRGGHGPIRYFIKEYDPQHLVVFEFQKPKGFHGIHQFEIKEINPNQTQVTHTIDMQTSRVGTLQWIVAVRSLHDALIEDAFDKMENLLTQTNKESTWSMWVQILRGVLR